MKIQGISVVYIKRKRGSTKQMFTDSIELEGKRVRIHYIAEPPKNNWGSMPLGKIDYVSDDTKNVHWAADTCISPIDCMPRSVSNLVNNSRLIFTRNRSKTWLSSNFFNTYIFVLRLGSVIIFSKFIFYSNKIPKPFSGKFQPKTKWIKFEKCKTGRKLESIIYGKTRVRVSSSWTKSPAYANNLVLTLQRRPAVYKQKKAKQQPTRRTIQYIAPLYRT